MPNADGSCYTLSPAPYLLFYNLPVLALLHTAMSVITWLFLVGVAGSLLVILISFFQDLSELIGKD
ncbi:MAG: hypothetical protein WA294_17765 [Acidobacteriaceae bacterium]